MDKRNLTTEEFIRRARKKHGNRYDYSKTVYTYSREKVIITCRVHGDFEMTANNHASRGSNCLQCLAVTRRRRNIRDALKRRNWDFNQPKEYKLIPITQGKFTKVSNEDFDRVKGENWYLANGSVKTGDKLLHRIVANAESDQIVIHINGDKLDNRRENLRLDVIQKNTLSPTPNRTLKNEESKVADDITMLQKLLRCLTAMFYIIKRVLRIKINRVQ